MGRPTGAIESNDGDHFLIGIDPGVNTGFCLLHLNTLEIRSLYTLDFWSTYDLMLLSVKTLAGRAQIHIEQPSLVKSLYARHYKRLEETRSEIVTRDKIVWNAGENAREGTLMKIGLQKLGYVVFDCRPVGRKKWTHEEFQSITGWPDRSNQNVRDAAYLVWDKHWQEISAI
jgi:hypothetical protein